MTTCAETAIESALDSARRRGKSRLVGIFGKPVGHTLSPSMQNAAFEAAGMAEWHYAAFEVEPSELGEAIAAIKKHRLAGVNITVPHKEAVIQYLDDLDAFARRIGAVNTIAGSVGNSRLRHGCRQSVAAGREVRREGCRFGATGRRSRFDSKRVPRRNERRRPRYYVDG